AAGRPVQDRPYLVLELSAARTRDDWFRIPELAAGYAELQREFRRGGADGVLEALVAFRRTALTCNDLLFDDAVRLADQVSQRFAGLGPPAPVRSAGEHPGGGWAPPGGAPDRPGGGSEPPWGPPDR